AARVKPDYSVEQFFPTFHRSRIDYERFKKDFPFEDARAIVVMDAPDLFTPAGLAREAALEEDLAKIPGVVDTQGLTTVKDVVGTEDGIRMEKIFPRTDPSPDELAHGRKTATGDPLFTWNVAPPDGHATIVQVTLSKEHASKEATRTQFLLNAREVLKRHEAPGQKLILNGL